MISNCLNTTSINNNIICSTSIIMASNNYYYCHNGYVLEEYAIDPTGWLAHHCQIGAQWQCWLGRHDSHCPQGGWTLTWCRHCHECGVRYNTPRLLLLWAIKPWTTLLCYNISLTPALVQLILYPFLCATLKWVKQSIASLLPTCAANAMQCAEGFVL